MSIVRALRTWFQRWFGKSRSRTPFRSSRKLTLECLEDRTMPSAALLVQVDGDQLLGDMVRVFADAGVVSAPTYIDGLYRLSGDETVLDQLRLSLPAQDGINYA